MISYARRPRTRFPDFPPPPGHSVCRLSRRGSGRVPRERGPVTEPNDARHLELIAAAQRQWIDALTDLGGRNTLLYYKDRRAGHPRPGQPPIPSALERFEKTGGSRLTRLFQRRRRSGPTPSAGCRRSTARPASCTEERGIRAGYLATGLARWDELFLEPAAPVLLRGPDDHARPGPGTTTSTSPSTTRSRSTRCCCTSSPACSARSSTSPADGARSPAQLAKAAARRRDPGLRDRETQGHRHVHLRQAADGARPARRPATCSPTATWSPPSPATPDAQQLVAAEPDRDGDLGRRLGSGRRRAGGRLLRPRRGLLAAQRHRRRAGRAQPGHPRPARHRQEPDDREPDRRDGRPRPQGAVRRREAGRDRRGAVPARRRRPRRPGPRHPRGRPRPAADRRPTWVRPSTWPSTRPRPTPPRCTVV